MKYDTTEEYLRWIETQDPAPKAFLFPSPEEAGMLAACRLKHNAYKAFVISARHPLVKACARKGWLEVRPVKAKEGEPEHLFLLTSNGRAVLDAVLATRWPVRTDKE